MSPDFDLFVDPFLRWPTTTGGTRFLSLRDLLEGAGELAPVGAERPQTWFSAMRILLVLMHWTRPKVSDEEWQALWDAGFFPKDWLAEIDQAAKGKFRLFIDLPRDEIVATTARREDSPRRAFFQSFPPPGGKGGITSPAVLVAELPAGQNIIHTRPVLEDDVALCHPCAAAAMVEQSSFSCINSGGYFASAAGNYVTYAMPVAATLFQTLLLGWPLPVSPKGANDRPHWDGRHDPEEPFGTMAAMTWVPKHVVLLRSESAWRCTLCGAVGEHFVDRVVRCQLGDIGKTLVAKAKEGTDPHAIYVEIPPKTRKGTSTHRVLSLPHSLELQPQTWREVWFALLAGRCGAVERVGARASEGVAVRCVAPRADRPKVRCIESVDAVVPSNVAQRLLLATELSWFEGLLARLEEGRKPQAVPVRLRVAVLSAAMERPVEALFRRVLVAALDRGIEDTDVAAWREGVRRIVSAHVFVERSTALADQQQRQAIEDLLAAEVPT